MDIYNQSIIKFLYSKDLLDIFIILTIVEHVIGNVINDIQEFFLDYWISHQKLTGVYHTSYELILGANPVQSSDYPIIRSIIAECGLKKDDSIVDIGCGMGRFLGYLWLKGFRGDLLGVEIDRTYADFCTYLFRNKKNITIIHENALDICTGFNDKAILYLYNPFNAKVLDLFLSETKGSRIIYANDINRRIFEKHPRWKLDKTFMSRLNDGTPVSCSMFSNQPSAPPGSDQNP